MKFGAMVATRVADWRLLQFAEELGYDHGWVPDSQMIWSDCYAVLALAAANTSRIRLGTGVAIAGTRIAPVTAHSIASINQIAPGRVFLGIGTGHSGVGNIGGSPSSPEAFCRGLAFVRALLAGERATLDGASAQLPRLARQVPVYAAGSGPGVPVPVTTPPRRARTRSARGSR